MKSLALLLFSFILSFSAISQNGVYLFGTMNNAPGTTFDISVVIYSSPPVTAQFTVNPDGDITNGNGYWVDLPSPDWTHFEVLYPTCDNETNILTVPADSLPNMIDVSYVVDYCPAVQIYGCTDANALNYDPNATLDDGSCTYVENTGCVDVNLDVFCVDTLSNAYDLTIVDDPFCCENYWDQLCQQNYETFGGLPLPECAEVVIPGCTDPNAINYNADATVDDGSCLYNDSCMANTVEILLITDQWGQEVSWVLFHEGDTVAADGGYQNNSTYTYPLCLEDGCYTFEMYDSFGDGWNGAIFSVVANGGVVANGSLNSGNFGFVDFGINSPNCDSLSSFYGCTDPLANNYDPNANIDDGSCTYETIDNDLCADATALQPGTQLISNVGAVNNENIWGECWAFGNGEGEQTSIWFSFTTPDEPASIHIEASPDGTNTLTDTQFGLFEECGGEMIYCDGNAGLGLFSAFDFACGELETNTTYILMIDGYYGDAGTCYLTYEVDTICSASEGCTDPVAINYDPNATIDDGSCSYIDSCESNIILVEINTETWGYEMSWNITQDGDIIASGGDYESNNTYSEWVCLENGCYTFEMLDSYGDGWNGGSFTITENNLLISEGTLPSGEFGTMDFSVNSDGCPEDIAGCIDPEATNYNPNATVNDGSCVYGCGELSFEFVPFGDPILGCVISTEATYTGDDPSGTLVWDFGAGTPALPGNNWTSGYQYSENGEYLVCATYYTENCTLQFCDTLVTYGCNGEIYGCTDPVAVNYDANADTDDGTCIYADSCATNFVQVQINTLLWGNEVSWSLLDGNTIVASGDGYENGSTYDQWLCLEDGCYTFEMYDSWGDGWNGGEYVIIVDGEILSTGTLSDGEYDSAIFGINTVCDDEIYGCTDPEAINYNPNATTDDGSCQYEECPNTLYLTLTDTGNLPDSAYVYWAFSENNEEPVAIGPHFSGDEPHEICAPDGCYMLIFGSIPEAWEGTYTLTLDGVVLASGVIDGDNGFMSVDVFSYLLGCEEDEEVYGCTDPNADNYNPNATIDDGSCEYQFDCAISFTVSPDTTGAQVIWITPSDNIYNAVTVEWDFGDGNTSTALFPIHTYEGDGPYMLCLTATFEDNGSFCEITYCAELTDEMINPPGMQSQGFSINVVDPLGTTGVDDIEWMSELSLWPNPATDMVQVEFALQENAHIHLEVYSTIGQVVRQSNVAAHSGKYMISVDVADLKPGMYFLRLTGNNDQMTTRLVVQ